MDRSVKPTLWQGWAAVETLSECPEAGLRPGEPERLSSEFGTYKTVTARFWPWLDPFLGHF